MADYSFKGKIPNTNYRGGQNNFSRNEGANNSIGNFTIKLKFSDKNMITDDKNSNYVDIAKEVIEKKLKRDEKRGKLSLTTTQIRNLLSLLAEIYKNVLSSENKELNDDIKAKIQYFRLKCIYQAGREPLVKDFVDKSGLLEIVNQIDNKKERFKNYYHYMEALVAWHKYYDGAD